MAATKSVLASYLEKQTRRRTQSEGLEDTLKFVTAFFAGVLLVWVVSYTFAEQSLSALVR